MYRRVKRFFSPPAKQSYFLFGPRGTGKSTWVKMQYPQALYIDLLISDVRRRYEAFPEDLIKAIAPLEGHIRVIIDEVQKVPELLSIVHALIEEKRNVQFILTGSSARKLKREGVDLLAGRAIKKEMHPFLASEIGDKFVLEKALKFGMLPLIWEAEDQEEVLESYVNLYVVEEVQFEGLVRNIGSFARFLSVISFSHASILNITNISRECEVKRSTVENFLGVLKDLLLSYEIPIFSKRAKRLLISHPKFYLFDSGIFQALRRKGPMDNETEIDGSALEGLIFQHLKAWCEYTKGKYEIFYWRTKFGLEVDFIIYGDKGFWAIEVKNGKKISSKDLRGLKNFIEDYPEAIPIFIYRGKIQLKEDDILCIPCDDFLKKLIPNQPII